MASAADTPGPRALTGGAVRAASAQIAVAAAGAITTLVVARILGPAGAGAYAVGLSLLMGLTALGTLGLETGISYMVGSGRWPARAAFARTQEAALVLGVAAALAGLGLRLIAPGAFEGLSVELILVTVSAMPFALSWWYASYVALAIDRYETYALPPVIQSVTALAGAVALAAAFGLDGALVGLAVSHAVAAASTFARARRDTRTVPGEGAADPGGRAGVRQAVAFGIKAYLANVLAFLQYRLDLFILNAVAAGAVVGQYAVAVSVTSAMWLLPRALSGVVVPRVASLDARDAGAHRDMVETKSLRHVSLIAIASTLPIAGVLVLLVELFFGDEFQPAIELGLILVPGSALLGIAGVLSATVVGRGRPVYSLYNALVMTPLTIGLYLWLVPILEAHGAALASTVSYTMTFLIACWFYRRLTGRRVLPLLVPTADEAEDYRRLWRLGVECVRGR